MQRPDLLLPQVLATLRVTEGLRDVDFCLAFPGYTIPSPLTKCAVALSVDSVTDKDVTPVYSKPEAGSEEPPVLLYNHVESQRIRMDIFVPLTSLGTRGAEVFSLINQVWKTGRLSPYFTGAGCKTRYYDRAAGATVMYTYFDLYQTSIKNA